MKILLASIGIMILAISYSFAQWSEQTSGITTALKSVSALDNNTVWICGASGRVLLTTNGGINWNIRTSPDQTLELSNVWGVNSTSALVTGTLAVPDTTYVFLTNDGGFSWYKVFSQAGGFIDGLSGDTSGNVIGMLGNPVGGRWSLWVSFSGGSNWDSTNVYIPQSGSETGWSNSLYTILLPTGDAYSWFGTNNSRIYRGLNGMDWTAQPTTGISNIYSIFFKDSMNGFAGGNTGMAFTSDDGTNWVVNTSVPGTGNITGIAAYGSEIWYARGTSIFYSSNNGTSWTIATTQTGIYTHLSIPKVANNNNIWAVRSNGGISKYSYPVGIKSVSNTVPKNYKLFQNYPNPFNPSTTIKFSIPRTSFTDITIYDELGNEVNKLVNENLSAGIYEVNFNTGNLSSGLYFYRLRTGKFTETRRMILIK